MSVDMLALVEQVRRTQAAVDAARVDRDVQSRRYDAADRAHLRAVDMFQVARTALLEAACGLGESDAAVDPIVSDPGTPTPREKES